MHGNMRGLYWQQLGTNLNVFSYDVVLSQELDQKSTRQQAGAPRLCHGGSFITQTLSPCLK